MIVRYMYNKAVYKINHIICDIMTFFILMIIVEPADSLWFFIVFCDSIFSHGRPTCIANKIVYAALNIFTVFIRFCIVRIVVIGFELGIDIESFRVIFIESVLSSGFFNPPASWIRRISFNWNVWMISCVHILIICEFNVNMWEYSNISHNHIGDIMIQIK